MDDVTQAVQTEFEVTKGLAIAGKELGSLALRFMKFIFETGKKLYEKRVEKNLNEKGEKTLEEITKLSKAGPPVIIEVNKDDLEAILKEGSNMGLHYAMLVDPDPNDSFIPITVTAEEGARWGSLVKVYADRKLSRDMEQDNSYDSSIDELTERLSNLKEGSDEWKECNIELENFKQAKQDLKDQIDYGKKIVSSKDEDIPIPLTEYVRRYKTTEAEVNPEIATAEYKKGVEIGQKMTAKDLFQPIRDTSFLPDSRLMFYVPELGAIVTREFHIDDKTGLAYSNYFFKADNGEKFTFSDHNMTTDNWNKDILPDFFSKSGILEGTLCRAFNDEDKLKRFLAYHGKLTSPSKEKVEEALKDNKEVFSNAEAKQEVLDIVSEQNKGFASAKINEDTIEIVCSPEMFTTQNGKLDFKLSEDEHIQFSGTTGLELAGEGKDNMFKISFSKNDNPVFVKFVGDAKTEIPMQLSQVKDRIEQALGNAASAKLNLSAKR